MRGKWIGWLCAALFVIPAARAQEEPLWEVGIGAAVTTLPDYRGADEGKTYLLPIPYFTYNGERLRIDRRGAHGDLIQKNNVWLDVSVNLGPPAKSDENQARNGMPDLDPTLEFGPSLRWLWWMSEDRDSTLTLYLPLRSVLATDFSHSQSIGWVFAPHVTYDVQNFGPGGGWNFGVSLGPLYATEKYHDYYYQVSPEFATATRPAYDAEGGYSGLRATLSLSKRFPKFWVGGFVRYDDLHNVAFEDSPLMRKESSLMAGVGISWIFARSKETVPVRPVVTP
jgi:MipA family protein